MKKPEERNKEWAVVLALAAIGAGQVQRNAGKEVVIDRLFNEALIDVAGLEYNFVLKTMTEICQHAKRDPLWTAATPDPVSGWLMPE